MQLSFPRAGAPRTEGRTATRPCLTACVGDDEKKASGASTALSLVGQLLKTSGVVLITTARADVQVGVFSQPYRWPVAIDTFAWLAGTFHKAIVGREMNKSLGVFFIKRHGNTLLEKMCGVLQCTLSF